MDDDGNHIFKPYLWNGQYLAAPTNSSNNELQLSDDLTAPATKWTLYKQENISNGTYYIQNFDTRKYADLYGPYIAEGTKIHQWDLNANDLSSISSWRQWQITKQSDSYYTIKNVYSGKYMGLDTSTLAIKQYTLVSDHTKWKVYQIDTDESLNAIEYIFVPKGYNYPPYSYSLSVEDGFNQNGRDLVLKSIDETRISWDLTDATMTYISRIHSWEYKDTRYNYYFGYYEPQTYVNGVGLKGMDLYIYNNDRLTDPDFTSRFNSAMDHAENQWENALSPYIYDFPHVAYESIADILVYGGDIDYFGYEEVNFAGVTGFEESGTTEGFVIYENEILRVLAYNKMYTKIINYEYNDDQFDMNVVVTHEMGHALGYAGHAHNWKTAVMNGSYSTYVLQTDEIEHLKQIWELFYE